MWARGLPLGLVGGRSSLIHPHPWDHVPTLLTWPPPPLPPIPTSSSAQGSGFLGVEAGSGWMSLSTMTRLRRGIYMAPGRRHCLPYAFSTAACRRSGGGRHTRAETVLHKPTFSMQACSRGAWFTRASGRMMV